MKKLIQTKDKGFTLIEVVIVMAIGALILFVVIQAVGNARRSQRDGERRTDAAQVAGLLEEFKANRGVYPHTSQVANDNNTQGVGLYDQSLIDKYTFQSATCNGVTISPTTRIIRYYVVGGAARSDYRIFACLESGGEVQIQLNN